MKRVKLKEYCAITRGKEPGSNAYSQGNIPFIRVGTLSNSKNIVYVAKNSKFTYVNKSDLLFSTDGSPGIVKMGFEGYISSGIVKIEPKNQEELNLKYLFYYLKTPQVQQIVKDCSKGTTIKHASSCLDKIEIPLLSIEEQERIVEILDQVYENIGWDIDDKIADLKALKKSAIDKAIRGQLTTQNPLESVEDLYKSIQEEKERLIKEGKMKKSKKDEIKPISEDEMPFEIPKNWKWCRLGEVGEWKSGGTPLKSNLDYYTNGTINWLRTGELKNNIINKVELQITTKAVNDYNLIIHKPNSVAIAMYGATIGRVGVLKVETTTNQACCVCKTNLTCSYNYLFYYLLSQYNNFVSQGAGGAQPNISKEKIVNTLIPLPPLEEQERIVNILSAIDSAIDSAIKVREDNRKLLNSLLNKYLSV